MSAIVPSAAWKSLVMFLTRLNSCPSALKSADVRYFATASTRCSAVRGNSQKSATARASPVS